MSWLTALLDPSTVATFLGGGGALGFVGAKFHKMDAEIRDCRKRDSHVVILMAGVRLMVGEMRSKLPDSDSLRIMGEILGKAFGPPPSADELEQLIKQVDESEKRHAHRA